MNRHQYYPFLGALFQLLKWIQLFFLFFFSYKELFSTSEGWSLFAMLTSSQALVILGLVSMGLQGGRGASMRFPMMISLQFSFFFTLFFLAGQWDPLSVEQGSGSVYPLFVATLVLDVATLIFLHLLKNPQVKDDPSQIPKDTWKPEEV